jgi:hypothetical protein
LGAEQLLNHLLVLVVELEQHARLVRVRLEQVHPDHP